MTTEIEDAFMLIEKGDYVTAKMYFSSFIREENLDPTLAYNAHFGLALCLFHDYSQTSSQTELLESTLSHAEAAAEIYEKRYDLQFLIGQCYAARYLQTKDISDKQKARAAYNATKEYAALSPILESVRSNLNQRIDILLHELGEN